jgi:hypothetical protein
MGILGTFTKVIIGVGLGTIVSGLIAKYASIGSLTFGSYSVAYSDILCVVIFGVIAVLMRSRMESVSQVTAIASASQIWFIVYKLLSQSGVVA